MGQMVAKEGKQAAVSSFWNGKKVFITGHTGFKGAWLSFLLLHRGADVYGYALEPEVKSLFNILALDKHVKSTCSDIRDYNTLKDSLKQQNPDVVFHMAAQPLVRDSYREPRYTYEVNVMGTVNLLDALRDFDKHISVVNVTTDKVYDNKEWMWGYRENETLGGFDPYSNSKACSELVTKSYIDSFFPNNGKVRISTARAGNVIGGGDFALDRIVPDCFKAAANGEKISIRNPASIRPYQHVLDCLNGYMILAEKQYLGEERIKGAYNFGPEETDCINTLKLVQHFCESWGESLKWEIAEDHEVYHEAHYLKLDSSKAKNDLGWRSVWNIIEAIDRTAEWYKAYLDKQEMATIVDNQIRDFYGEGI